MRTYELEHCIGFSVFTFCISFVQLYYFMLTLTNRQIINAPWAKTNFSYPTDFCILRIFSRSCHCTTWYSFKQSYGHKARNWSWSSMIVDQPVAHWICRLTVCLSVFRSAWLWQLRWWFDGGGSAGATSFVGSDGGGDATTPVGNANVGSDGGVERKYSVASAKRISKSARWRLKWRFESYNAWIKKIWMPSVICSCSV